MLKILKALTTLLCIGGLVMMLGAVGNDDYMMAQNVDFALKSTIAHMSLGAGLATIGWLATKFINEEIEHRDAK